MVLKWLIRKFDLLHEIFYYSYMARKWTAKEVSIKKAELRELYTVQNLTLSEVARKLRLSETGVYDRLLRLRIPISREKKEKFNNQNLSVRVPIRYSQALAEFVGILLGDGHLTPTQVTVTLGTKELAYAVYVANLLEGLVGVKPKIAITKRGDKVVYIGSTRLVRWFLSMGLAHNKVFSQVCAPDWCYGNKSFCRAFLRGLIDTDGSIYLMRRRALQISFCNKSKPLLYSARLMLMELGFHPSRVGEKNIYLTRKEDIYKYVTEIGFKNPKHTKRLQQFIQILGGSYSGNYS